MISFLYFHASFETFSRNIFIYDLISWTDQYLAKNVVLSKHWKISVVRQTLTIFSCHITLYIVRNKNDSIQVKKIKRKQKIKTVKTPIKHIMKWRSRSMNYSYFYRQTFHHSKVVRDNPAICFHRPVLALTPISTKNYLLHTGP